MSIVEFAAYEVVAEAAKALQSSLQKSAMERVGEPFFDGAKAGSALISSLADALLTARWCQVLGG